MSEMSHPAPTPRMPAYSSASKAEPVLEVRGLNVDYGFGTEAVHAVVDCNLVLRRGQVLGLAGESGSGKSTIAMAAIRLLRSPGVITAGEVIFPSRPLEGESSGQTLDLLRADDA